MKTKRIHLRETISTNNWLHSYMPTEGEQLTVCTTDYQTAGRGCGSNTWESERGKNLLFSILMHPVEIAARQQFAISEMVALALHQTVAAWVEGVSIKWPNDIYVGDRKIAGILIENRLNGSMVKDCIVGIGLNVNQTHFISDAPNPVSLKQLLGHEVEREHVLQKFLAILSELIPSHPLTDIHEKYLNRLYRREGFFRFSDRKGTFEARISGVEPDGHLLLEDRMGTLRTYAFKEVAFLQGL